MVDRPRTPRKLIFDRPIVDYINPPQNLEHVSQKYFSDFSPRQSDSEIAGGREAAPSDEDLNERVESNECSQKPENPTMAVTAPSEANENKHKAPVTTTESHNSSPLEDEDENSEEILGSCSLFMSDCAPKAGECASV